MFVIKMVKFMVKTLAVISSVAVVEQSHDNNSKGCTSE